MGEGGSWAGAGELGAKTQRKGKQEGRAQAQTMLSPLWVFAMQHHRTKAADNVGLWVAGPSPTTSLPTVRCPCQQWGGCSLTVP